MENHHRNGQATGSANPAGNVVEPEILSNEALPVYRPDMPPQSIVIRREMVWGVAGIAVGVGLTLWIMSMCAKTRR